MKNKNLTRKEFEDYAYKIIGESPDFFLNEDCPIETARYIWVLFFDKWAEKNMGGWKMRWQMEKTFDLRSRMRTFINNQKKWHPERFKKAPPKNPQGLKAPVIKKTPEQIAESEMILKEGYKRKMEEAKTKVKYEPTAFGVIKRKEIKEQQESKKQSEQNYTDYE